MKNRTLVDRALAKAEQYEKQGDKAKADHFFKLAEKADLVYDKIEKQKGLRLQKFTL